MTDSEKRIVARIIAVIEDSRRPHHFAAPLPLDGIKLDELLKEGKQLVRPTETSPRTRNLRRPRPDRMKELPMEPTDEPPTRRRTIDFGKSIAEVATNNRSVGAMMFRIRAAQALYAAGMADAAKIVLELPLKE